MLVFVWVLSRFFLHTTTITATVTTASTRTSVTQTPTITPVTTPPDPPLLCPSLLLAWHSLSANELMATSQELSTVSRWSWTENDAPPCTHCSIYSIKSCAVVSLVARSSARYVTDSGEEGKHWKPLSVMWSSVKSHSQRERMLLTIVFSISLSLEWGSSA